MLFFIKMGQCGPRPKNNFFWEITKAAYKLSKTFYYMKISYVLAELWIFFYFDCFLPKASHLAFVAIAVVLSWPWVLRSYMEQNTIVLSFPQLGLQITNPDKKFLKKCKKKNKKTKREKWRKRTKKKVKST